MGEIYETLRKAGETMASKSHNSSQTTPKKGKNNNNNGEIRGCPMTDFRGCHGRMIFLNLLKVLKKLGCYMERQSGNRGTADFRRFLIFFEFLLYIIVFWCNLHKIE